MAKTAELALLLSLVDQVSSGAEQVKDKLLDVGRSGRGAQETLDGLAKIGKGVLTAGMVAGGAAIAAVGGLLATTIGPASDLNETVSKVGVVFGKEADNVLTFGENSASALGMSTNAALAAAGTYGNLFRAMGIGEKTSAEMSTSLVQLAADLASFNNASPEDALDALRSGLAGETEPLKRFGINLNDATLKAKALQMGLYDGKGVLDASARAQAAYALIMEQTSLAQGDFARTSGGLANQQRILAANMENLRARVGTSLLPLMTTLSQTLINLLNNPTVQAGINTIVNGLSSLATKASEAITLLAQGDVKGALTGVFGPEVAGTIMNVATTLSDFVNNILLPFIRAHLPELKGALIGIGAVLAGAMIISGILSIGSAIAALASPIGIIIAAAALLGAAWAGNWLGIRDTLMGVWNALQPVLQTLWAWLQQNIPLAVQFLADAWNNVLMPAINAVWSFLSTYLLPLLGALANLIEAALEVALKALAGLITEVVVPALKSIWSTISEKLQPVLEWLRDKALPPIEGAFRGIGDAVRTVIGWINDLADKLRNITLPDWLTPGSPTPFELGLRGIASAMRDISASELPRFSTGLAARGLPTVAIDYDRLGQAVASAVGNKPTYQIVAQYRYQDERSVRDDIRLLQILHSAT